MDQQPKPSSHQSFSQPVDPAQTSATQRAGTASSLSKPPQLGEQRAGTFQRWEVAMLSKAQGTFCALCQAPCQSEKCWEAHLRGSRHKAAVAREEKKHAEILEQNLRKRQSVRSGVCHAVPSRCNTATERLWTVLAVYICDVKQTFFGWLGSQATAVSIIKWASTCYMGNGHWSKVKCKPSPA